MTDDIVLAGDLGGTNTRLALIRVQQKTQETLHEEHFSTADYNSLLPMAKTFLSKHEQTKPRRACIAIAGPVQLHSDGQTGLVTRHQWPLDSRLLTQQLGLQQLKLINDFEAIGHAIDVIPKDQLHTLQEGQADPQGIRALIGAGTGLGQAILIPGIPSYQVLPTEGGHADFAPRDRLQIALLNYLLQEYPHVSYERVLSGPGLENIYRFFQQRFDHPDKRDVPINAAHISEQALAGTDKLAQQALDLFLEIYGAQAGNLALATMARGGVYIAGGIAPKILSKFAASGFLNAFHQKGRMQPLQAHFPIKVVLAAQPGLMGAAQLASRL